MATVDPQVGQISKESLMEKIHTELDFKSNKRKTISNLLGITFAQAGNLAKSKIDEFNIAELKTFLRTIKESH
jgi:predicted XRE-type DNA-binding protein